MGFSANEQKLISQLVDMIDKFYITLEQLDEDTALCYQALKKVKNILKSKNPNGMKNVKKHLMMDFRMIEDRQLEGDALDELLESIYYHVSNNKLFHASKN